MSNPAGKVIPKFRDSFGIVSKHILRWFPGHMHKGLKQMQQQLKNVDCIIEVHDARVPISGRYADFSHTLTGLKPHILVLNKIDLADMNFKKAITSELNKQGLSRVLFTNMRSQQIAGAAPILPLARKLITESNRFNRTEEQSYTMMIIGIPNVGKSSLINRLRNKHLHKGNAANVGGVAGITRSVSTKIKISESPPIYLLDTPGILTPNMDDTYTGLKLAVIGCLQDHLVGPEMLADFLLFWLNKHSHFQYVKAIGLPEPNDDILYVLTFIAAKMKKVVRMKQHSGVVVQSPNLRYAAEYFLTMFRKGHFGKYCLDEDLLQSSTDKVTNSKELV